MTARGVIGPRVAAREGKAYAVAAVERILSGRDEKGELARLADFMSPGPMREAFLRELRDTIAGCRRWP